MMMMMMEERESMEIHGLEDQVMRDGLLRSYPMYNVEWCERWGGGLYVVFIICHGPHSEEKTGLSCTRCRTL